MSDSGARNGCVEIQLNQKFCVLLYSDTEDEGVVKGTRWELFLRRNNIGFGCAGQADDEGDIEIIEEDVPMNQPDFRWEALPKPTPLLQPWANRACAYRKGNRFHSS